MHYSFEVPEGRSETIPLNVYLKIFGTYLGSRWQLLLILVLTIGGNIVLQLINPRIISTFIDNALEGAAQDVLIRMAVTFLILSLVQQGLVLVSTYLAQLIAWGSTNDLRNDVMAHCLSLDLSFHNNHTPGEMIERIVGDIQQLGDFFSRMTVLLTANILLIAGILFQLWKEDWRLGLPLTIFVVVVLAILFFTRNIAVKSFRAARQAFASVFGFVE